MEVYGTNTELENVKLGPCAAGESRVVVFAFDCNLCPQAYTLTAATHDPNGVWHDWLEDAVAWLKRLGVTYLRTGLSWADWERPGAQAWFDRLVRALEDFDVTVTFCFTPERKGIAPHHTSPPQRNEEFAEWCASMIRRYASGSTAHAAERSNARR